MFCLQPAPFQKTLKQSHGFLVIVTHCKSFYSVLRIQFMSLTHIRQMLYYWTTSFTLWALHGTLNFCLSSCSVGTLMGRVPSDVASWSTRFSHAYDPTSWKCRSSSSATFHTFRLSVATSLQLHFLEVRKLLSNSPRSSCCCICTLCQQWDKNSAPQDASSQWARHPAFASVSVLMFFCLAVGSPPSPRMGMKEGE